MGRWKDVCRLSSISSLIFTEQGPLFYVRKIVPLGYFLKILDLHNIFSSPRKKRICMNTRFQNQRWSLALNSLQMKKGRYKALSPCWQALGNELKYFFSFGIVWVTWSELLVTLSILESAVSVFSLRSLTRERLWDLSQWLIFMDSSCLVVKIFFYVITMILSDEKTSPTQLVLVWPKMTWVAFIMLTSYFRRF